MEDYISVTEASIMCNRNRVAIYRWARDGHVRSKIVKTNPRQTKGKTLFHVDDLIKCAEVFEVGHRTDIFGLTKSHGKYKGQTKYKPHSFTEDQLEIARRVMANA
jgi:ribosomal protein L3